MGGKECSQDLIGRQDLVRCSFQLPRELYEELRVLEWGARGLFITACLASGLDKVREHGIKYAYLLINRKTHLFVEEPNVKSKRSSRSKDSISSDNNSH